jgi:hypothetical protein
MWKFPLQKGEKMFAYNSFIDSFQYGKKTFVNMFITDEKIKSSLNAFVDTQTVFAKQSIKTFEDVSESMINEFKKKMKDA